MKYVMVSQTGEVIDEKVKLLSTVKEKLDVIPENAILHFSIKPLGLHEEISAALDRMIAAHNQCNGQVGRLLEEPDIPVQQR